MEIKKTKAGYVMRAYAAYMLSNIDDIHLAYKRCSNSKIEAWEYCKKLCNEYEGTNLKIISANRYLFSAGFVCKINGFKSFVYITKSNEVYLELE